jgi:hypothetical protein
LPSTVTWLSPVSGDWDTPANWDGGRVPGSSDDVVIPFPSITVTHAMPTAAALRSISSEADINISAGRIEISGDLITMVASRIDGRVTVSGGSLTIGADNRVFGYGVILSGTGALRNFATLNLMPNCTLSVTMDNEAGLFIDSGFIHNDADRPFVNAPGATVQLGGNPDDGFFGPASVDNGFTNQGRFVFVRDMFDDILDLTVQQGTMVNAPGATLDFNAPAKLFANLDNQGVMTVEGGGRIERSSGTFTNEGTLSVTGTLRISQSAFTNSGTVRVMSGSGIAVLNGNYTQLAGSTQLANGSLAAAGLVDLEGGVLAGTGVISGSVLNNAEVDVGQPGAPGTLTIAGDYTQTSGGVLMIEIGDPSSGTSFDQLTVTGQAVLDGTLTVHLINGFQPPSGDSFQVLSFGSGSGTFTTIDGDGPLFTPSYDPTDVILIAN